MTAAELIAAEEQVVQLWRDGEVNALTHFCGSMDGSYEKWLVDFFHHNVRSNDFVFASHRCHYHFLLQHETFTFKRDGEHWSPQDQLLHLVKHGKSMFLYSSRFICSAIVAGTAGVAAGMALAFKMRGEDRKVFCFMGDGAEDQGGASEAIWFVHERQLPCTFIIEDNCSSCGVSREQRRGSNADRPWPDCVVRIHYKPRWPHAGTPDRPTLKSLHPAA